MPAELWLVLEPVTDRTPAKAGEANNTDAVAAKKTLLTFIPVSFSEVIAGRGVILSIHRRPVPARAGLSDHVARLHRRHRWPRRPVPAGRRAVSVMVAGAVTDTDPRIHPMYER